MAMQHLGNGLCEADLDEDALSVREAELSMSRRLGASESNILVVQCNLLRSRIESSNGLTRLCVCDRKYTLDV